MDDNYTDLYLQHFIEEYLLGRGIIRPTLSNQNQPDVHDHLGLDNFVEGRNRHKQLVLFKRNIYLLYTHKSNQVAVASGLMRRLLILMHQQWIANMNSALSASRFHRAHQVDEFDLD